MNINELDSYNLADAVKFNDQLNPRLWGKDEHLKPEVRDRLLEIANDFREFLGINDLQLKDITISGSNAAYTYTPHSDIDLHLVVDLPEADASEVYRELFDAKKYQYNAMHNIKIGGYDVELYVQDANKGHVSQGIYSVLNNEWIDVPKRRKPDVDDISTRSKYEDLSERIDQALASGDNATITSLTEKIREMRQAGLDQHGEFGPENLAFKMLRTQGKIKELYDARNAAKDRELSLKERKKPNSVFTYGFKHPAEEQKIPEAVKEPSKETKSDESILKDFINFCFKELKLKAMPTVKLRKDPQWSVRNKTFGRYIDDYNLLEVAWGQRHIMDVLRTVAHELTHRRQHEREDVPTDAGETGSRYENEANARAGILMRDYARLHPDYFEVGQTTDLKEASGYIPTAAEAHDPRFEMALSVDIRPGALGKAANALDLHTDSQGRPQLLRADGLFESLMAEFKRTKIAEAVQPLDEVRMAPSNLKQWAASPEAQGIRSGFEAELIFRDTTSDGDDQDGDMEPDYDMDERCRSIQGIIDFFQNGDYGGMSSRQESALQNGLDEQYMEWFDQAMYDEWADERDDLIKEAWLRDKPMSERIHVALVDGLELDDRQADAVEQLASDREAGKIKGSDMSEEQLEMISQYSEARQIAEDILQEDVEQTIEKQDGFYDEVLDDFRDGFYTDDDSGFFSDVGLVYMSDVANEYDLEWPYLMNSGNGNGGSRDWDEIGTSLQDTIDMPVTVSSGYHSAKRKEGLWIVEPDSSLDPDDREDYGLEIVSPPMPLLVSLDKLQEVCDWANDPSEGNAYTNSSTGLHMGVSVPFKGGDVDYLKLVLFMGDEYVLQQFGREANTYTKSAMSKFKENLKGGRVDVAGTMKLMQDNLIELAQREVQKGVGEGKYTSVHVQKGYIEFRSAGGDWLAEESADPEKLQNTMLRYAYAMSLAANPAAERREYAKKLYKLISPEGDSQLALFSQFSAGELTAEQLKKLWAEKTIGKEKKTNQRWKLYKMVDGVWTAVPGAEWNGYEEDQVKNAVWSKYGRQALDSGEYQLVNMGEQDWEVYDVKTGQTLEIVKGKSKGEVADKVYDKYVDQGIGFQVRPYEDPNKLTPRAKLAQRIKDAPEEQPQMWQVVNKKTGEVYDTVRGTQSGLGRVLRDFEKGEGIPQGDAMLRLAPEQKPEADTVDNYRGKWEFFYAPTGRVLDAVTDASIMQARAVLADTQRRYNDLQSDQIQMRKAQGNLV